MAPTSPAASLDYLDAFRGRLRDLGHTDGHNILIDVRHAEGRAERFSDLVAELLRLNVDVIAIGSAPGAVAAKKATSTTPIVFLGVTDPIGSGIVQSLARPGGNITGTALIIGDELAGKWVELVRDVIPQGSSIAALGHSTHPMTPTYVAGMEEAARTLGLRLRVFHVRDLADLDNALTTIGRASFDALVVTASPFFGVNRKKIASVALAYKIPTITFYREFVMEGALASYGPNFVDSYRRGAVYVDKILKGAKPADLPVEQSTQFELVMNLKTAKELGIPVSAMLLARADEVIE